MTSRIPYSRTGPLLVSLALLLAACGGSNERERVAETPPTGTTPPGTTTDSFFSLVAARVATLLDNDEPVAIDSAVATTPENTEPAPLPAS
ncbi:hypothetical protein [Massilia sp. MS-15]|uniref:hypothetical protein n=1 Tax=Massilia sp. MS-15 TaxID=2878200 RepID=UPI001CD6608B|nr:hypothetical protein [Massilia sp. MS-15]MCA1247899.1 hypothetical protein [Massilia sp. MS-15]